MDITDYMIIKLIALAVLAFIVGFAKEFFTVGKEESQEQEQKRIKT